jgi:SAM-dependent methyltransferase
LGTSDALAALERTTQRYRACGRFAYRYVGAKLRYDPLYGMLPSLAARQTFGSVLDIGCGRGQLGIALLESGAARVVLGFDQNRVHLRQAARAAVDLPLRVEPCDLTQCEALPMVDTVFLIDVCYQLPTNVQNRLLRAAAVAARSCIVIRTADPAQGWRSTLSRVLEWSCRPFWPHSGAHVNPRPLRELIAIVTDSGFSVTVMPCWRGTPFCNVLLVGRRAAVESDAASHADEMHTGLMSHHTATWI